MKKTLSSSAFLLAAALLFAPVGAGAALYTGDWNAANVVTAPGQTEFPVATPPLDILSTRFVQAGTDYFFRMDLAAAPATTGSTYMIEIGTTADSVNYALEAEFRGGTRFDLFYTNPWFLTSTPFEVAFTQASGAVKPFLEWRIGRDEITDPISNVILDSFFFSGYAYRGSTDDWTETVQATPTPIPGAVWLLGSGLVGLLGLRARKKV